MRAHLFSFVMCLITIKPLLAQTNIAIPPAKVEFSSLGKMGKPQIKNLRFKEKMKQRKVDEIGKFIRKNTNLPMDEINKYKQVLNGLDSAELKQFENGLYSIGELEAYNLKKEKEELKRARTKYKRDSLSLRGIHKKECLEGGCDGLRGWRGMSLSFLRNAVIPLRTFNVVKLSTPYCYEPF